MSASLQLKPILIVLVLIRDVYPDGLNMFNHCESSQCFGTECGLIYDRPQNGVDSMRRTRAAYHYAIRDVKRNEHAIVCERIADTVLDDEGRNFWADFRRIRSRQVIAGSWME